MDISSLLFNRPSLANYLDGGSKSGGFSGSYSSSTALTQSLFDDGGAGGNSAVSLNLSAEAQAIMAQYNGGQQSSGQSTEEAQRFLLEFFADGGIDLENLSAEAEEFLDGLLQVIENMGASGRDAGTDALEKQASKGERDVYTLLGDNRRFRIAIEKGDDGKSTLSIVDIGGDKADIAKVTIGKNQSGATIIHVEHAKESFSHGKRIDRAEQEPLMIKV